MTGWALQHIDHSLTYGTRTHLRNQKLRSPYSTRDLLNQIRIVACCQIRNILTCMARTLSCSHTYRCLQLGQLIRWRLWTSAGIHNDIIKRRQCICKAHCPPKQMAARIKQLSGLNQRTCFPNQYHAGNDSTGISL